MLNGKGVTVETVGMGNQILFAVEHQVSVGIVVSASSGVSVGNKKIVKAGTILSGDLGNRIAPFKEAVDSASGVLLHDVDVTEGDANGSLLIFGFVNTNRIDSDVKGKITNELKAKIPAVQFVAC